MTLGRPGVFTGVCALTAGLTLASAQQPFDPGGRPNRSVNGPWNNDVLVYRVTSSGISERVATFPRAGVPTMTRMPDGRLIAAHQHFPEDNDADFDKVAVHFSSDEGRTWTPPVVIAVSGLPDGMRFPFDPTLVTLPDGRIRLYFTGMIGRRIDQSPQVIQSAVSADGVTFTFEPGARFAVAGRPVIDCAVALHQGVFHLFAPDNGPASRGAGPGPSEGDGIGYHATSTDGLTFTRQDDVRVGTGRRWLGNALSDGGQLWFFGTGGPGGVWTATSSDGNTWQPGAALRVQAADPGVVRLRDGAWLILGTGPPVR